MQKITICIEKSAFPSELKHKTYIHYIFKYAEFEYANKEALPFLAFSTGCCKKYGTFLL